MSYLLLLSSLAALAQARLVTLSNTVLPLDTSGAPLLTGETSILAYNGTYYFYVNNWGGCPAVDCCPSATGCASCCFAPSDPCVYTANHSVVLYSTRDFASWTPHGEVLGVGDRRPGIEFRPQVVYCAATGKFLMYYEDRWSTGSNPGYALAAADSPAGPFTAVSDSVRLGGKGRVGDYDVFVDPASGSAYHIRTGLTIQRLAANYSAAEGAAVDLPNGGVEGPAMFERAGAYYLLAGQGCCACRGGSNVLVYRGASPSGPFALQGDVGSNHTAGHVFDAHSPYNYVTRAQQTKVVRVPDAAGGVQYLWVGNQWVSEVGAPRNTNLLYFALLQFSSAGEVLQMDYSENCTLSLPD